MARFLHSDKTVIVFVLHEFRTLSFTLRGERRLRMFEKKVLGKAFEPKSEEVTGG
jgi:hypothetical protein